MSYLGEIGIAGRGRMRRGVCRIIGIAIVIELVGGQEGFVGFVKFGSSQYVRRVYGRDKYADTYDNDTMTC
jgi:hypothetical protein